MSKYQYTDKCQEISGFGGNYEDGCRKMVIAGIEWIDAHQEANPSFKEYKQFYGLMDSTNEDAKALTDHMNEAIHGEATGAMMQACVNHVRYIKQNGWDKYIELMEKPEVATD